MPKKRKRRVNAAELRQMAAPTEDFEFENPHDPDEVIVVTAQRLSPGHLMTLDRPSLIRLFSPQEDVEGEASEPEPTAEVDIEEIVSNIQTASEISALAIIDPDTRENIYSKEDCLFYIPTDTLTEVANYALERARPIDEENPDAVDRFPAEPDGETEDSEVETG